MPGGSRLKFLEIQRARDQLVGGGGRQCWQPSKQRRWSYQQQDQHEEHEWEFWGAEERRRKERDDHAESEPERRVLSDPFIALTIAKMIAVLALLSVLRDRFSQLPFGSSGGATAPQLRTRAMWSDNESGAGRS